MALRFGMASLLLAILTRRLRIPLLGPGRRGVALLFTQALGAFGIGYAVIYWAEQWVPSGLASVLFATLPFFVALFGHFALPGSDLGWRAMLGLLLGFAGVAVIFGDDLAALGGEQVRFGGAVLLLSPVAVAASQIAVKRWASSFHTFTLTALPMGAVGAPDARAFGAHRKRPADRADARRLAGGGLPRHRRLGAHLHPLLLDPHQRQRAAGLDDRLRHPGGGGFRWHPSSSTSRSPGT